MERFWGPSILKCSVHILCFSICLILISEFLFISMKIRPLFSKSSFSSLSSSLLWPQTSTRVSSATLGPADCDKMNRELFGRKTAAANDPRCPFSLLLPTDPARRIINLTLALNRFKGKKMPTEIIVEPLKEVPKEGIVWWTENEPKRAFWKRELPVVWGWLVAIIQTKQSAPVLATEPCLHKVERDDKYAWKLNLGLGDSFRGLGRADYMFTAGAGVGRRASFMGRVGALPFWAPARWQSQNSRVNRIWCLQTPSPAAPSFTIHLGLSPPRDRYMAQSVCVHGRTGPRPSQPGQALNPQTAFCNISLQKGANPAKKRASTLGRETSSYRITLEGHSAWCLSYLGTRPLGSLMTKSVCFSTFWLWFSWILWWKPPKLALILHPSFIIQLCGITKEECVSLPLDLWLVGSN